MGLAGCSEQSADPVSSELAASDNTISRRDFLTASGALGLLSLGVAATGSLAGCEPEAAEDNEDLTTPPTPAGEDPTPISVTSEQLIEATIFNEQPLADYLDEVVRHTLPYGSIVYQINYDLALVLTPHEQGNALVDIYLLNLNDGRMVLLLNQAEGIKNGHDDAILYDARASESLLVWTECDIATMKWQVYAAAITEQGIDQPVLIDTGEPEYEVPLLAVIGNKAYWTVMPNPEGTAQYEDSYLKAMIYKQRQPWVVYTSHGRIITTPLISQETLTFSPRVDTKNVYYQLTALNTNNDKIINYSIMPQSMRIHEALYLFDRFVFSLENNYSYAAGLGYYGTYMPMSDGLHWLHLSRKPSAAPILLGGRLVLKSSTRVIGIDPEAQTYYSIPTLADAADYGDVLAGWGMQERLVVYCNVKGSGILSDTHGVVRVFEQVRPPEPEPLPSEPVEPEPLPSEPTAQ